MVRHLGVTPPGSIHAFFDEVAAISDDLGRMWSVVELQGIEGVPSSGMEVEQDRPYFYVVYGTEGPRGTDIVDLSNPSNPRVLYRWRIENQDLHVGPGGTGVKFFKWQGRYYLVQSLQFRQGGPNIDLGAVVLDVTGLPDPSMVREVARIREPEWLGGFHNIFIYEHSSGRVLLFATVSGPFAHVYDLGNVLDGDLDNPESLMPDG